MKKLLLLIIITGISLITTQKGLAEEDPWQRTVEHNLKDFLYFSSPENFAKWKQYDGLLKKMSQKDYETLIFHQHRLHYQCFVAGNSYSTENVGEWQKESRDVYRKIAKKLNWSKTRLSSVENDSKLLNKASKNIILNCPNAVSSLILKFNTPSLFNRSVEAFKRLEKDFNQQYELKIYTASASEKEQLIENYNENKARFINSNSPPESQPNRQEVKKDINEACQYVWADNYTSYLGEDKGLKQLEAFCLQNKDLKYN